MYTELFVRLPLAAIVALAFNWNQPGSPPSALAESSVHIPKTELLPTSVICKYTLFALVAAL